jgi:hypothetical protein
MIPDSTKATVNIDTILREPSKPHQNFAATNTEVPELDARNINAIFQPSYPPTLVPT